MTLEEFVKAAMAGKISVPGAKATAREITDGQATLGKNPEDITAEAFRTGMIDFSGATWEKGLAKVKELMRA